MQSWKCNLERLIDVGRYMRDKSKFFHKRVRLGLHMRSLKLHLMSKNVLVLYLN